MKKAIFWTLIFSLFLALPVRGQQRPVSERADQSVRAVQATEPESPATTNLAARDNQTSSPRLIKFSGVLTDLAGEPLSGAKEVTFKFYKQEADEDALWAETQTLELDKEGRYTVLLGATQAEGIPVELFSSAEARWVGIEVQGQRQQPRTLLVSVPYALKAVDAEKLAGKSVSDFVLSESLGEQVRQVIQAQGQVAAQSALAGTAPQKQTATSSTTNATTSTSASGPMFPPSKFSGTTSDQIVLVQQNGTGQSLAAFTGPTGGNGVYGQTAGTNASGVFGNATSTATSSFQNGVLGLNAGNGAGVAGIATNPSSGVGVYGASANFAGVFGNATSPSALMAGVLGQTASTNGAGVGGIANATSGFTNGVYGQNASTSGNGVQAVETATSGFTSGVNGSCASSSCSGVAGFATSTTGNTNGVAGQNFAPNGTGVAGVASATTRFNNGVYGATASSHGTGVSGNALSTTGNPIGVVGSSAGANGGVGVWGIFQATSGGGAGVRGDLESPTASGAAGLFLTLSPTSVAGQFANFSRQGLILQGLSGPFDATQKEVFRVDSSGNLHITGNLTVDGTKSSTAKLQDGREVALYAVESPENWFEDFGSGELNNGVAWVPLDASFAQAVNPSVAYHVFLTPNGDSNGLYVARKTASGFEIREHGGGTSNVAFDYRIVAKRRGYEAIRMLQVPERKPVETFVPHVELATARPKVEPVKIPPSASVPMIHPMPPALPVVPQAPKLNVPQPH